MREFMEKRCLQGRTVDLDATTVSPDGLFRHEAVIVDISEEGATIELPFPHDIPDRLTLLFGHRLQPCKTVWIDGRFASLRFMQAW